MPAATTRTDLLARTGADYDKLRRLIDPIPANIALRKRDEDTSIKDVIGHRAHWIDLFLGWQADGRAGKQVDFPAPGYKWSDLRAYNARLRADQAGLDWPGACALLADRHAALLALLQDLSQTDLYGGPMPGARNDWTTGRWAEAAGSAHYRSAAKWIRACLRADAEKT